MRTAEAIRANIVEHLVSALERPAMYGGELILTHLMEKILYIDDREDLLEAKRNEWESHGYWSPMGMARPLVDRFGGGPERFVNEVGSVCAQAAHEWGYLTLKRVLDEPEWRTLRSGLRQCCHESDMMSDQILEQHGPASISVGLNGSQVHCYATDQLDQGWIFFDCEWGAGGPSDGGSWRNPPLRDLRFYAKDASRGLVLTPFGRTSGWRPFRIP